MDAVASRSSRAIVDSGELSGTTVLALNSGSSSLKFGLYNVAGRQTRMVLEGEAETSGDGAHLMSAINATQETLLSESLSSCRPADVMQRLGRLIVDQRLPRPMAVGHRVVHGGPTLRQPILIDEAVLQLLAQASDFAPLHIPAALALIRLTRRHFPGLPQVACFDTGFHAGMPPVARVLPLARTLQDEGIQRYGFHGLSCESVLHQLGDEIPERMIIAHLGNGASITAVKHGGSIDTSMGLTPTGGIIMGTRSGDLDPGVLVYLLRKKQLDADALEALVDREAGLLGISGLSADMRKLHDAAATNTDVQLAVEMFTCSVRKQIAAMIAVLDGVDLIVFTGGIGEHDAEIRRAVVKGLVWMGINLDAASNEAHKNLISDPSSRCKVLVLPSREDEQIARHTAHLVN